MKEPLFIETIKIENGVFVRLERHLQRIQKTQHEAFGHSQGIGADVLHIPFEQRCDVVKCRILYGQTIQSISFVPYNPRTINSLQLIDIEDTFDYHLKYADRSVLNNLRKQCLSADDIMIIRQGLITDTSYSNIVFSDGKDYITPDSYLLNGTRRQYLLECGTIRTARITPSDIVNFDRVILINAMLGIEDNISIPVSHIAGL